MFIAKYVSKHKEFGEFWWQKSCHEFKSCLPPKIRRFLNDIGDIWQNYNKSQINNTYKQRTPAWGSIFGGILCINKTFTPNHVTVMQCSWDGVSAGTNIKNAKAIWGEKKHLRLLTELNYARARMNVYFVSIKNITLFFSTCILLLC